MQLCSVKSSGHWGALVGRKNWLFESLTIVSLLMSTDVTRLTHHEEFVELSRRWSCKSYKQLYISQVQPMFQHFHVQLVLKAIGNGYRNMQFVMFGRECVSVKPHWLVTCWRVTGNRQDHCGCCLCCVGEARSAMKAGLYFTFPWFVVYRYSDLNIPCSIVTANIFICWEDVL
jgi:hypothetical protein